MEKNLLKKITKLFIFSIAGGFLASLCVIDGFFRYSIVAFIFISVILIGLCITMARIIIDIFFKNKTGIKDRINYFIFFRGFIIGFAIMLTMFVLTGHGSYLFEFGSCDNQVIILISVAGGILGGIFDLVMTKFIHNS